MPLSRPDISRIFTYFQTHNPEPKTELVFTNPFTLLVAVVLSAQATDVSVNKATTPLFALVNTPEQMVALGEARLKTYISSIGLFNSKAKNVIALSQLLIERFASQVPSDLDALQSLPGVGEKTARVVLNCAFGVPTIAVDTHVQRVSNRIGLVCTKTAEATMRELPNVIPPSFLMHAHHWLILHGRYVCKARKPLCADCGIARWCKKNGVE